MAQMPLPLTISCFSKIQIGFTFLVPAHPGSPGQRAVKRVCVCVLSDQLSQNEDLCQLFKVSRTVTVDDQAESFFLIPQVTLSWQTNSVDFSAWLSLDAGTAGWALPCI